MQAYIYKLVNRQDLSAAEMTQAMETIMTGQATDAQIGAFITAMRMKGETVTEIAAAARVMRAKATRIPVAEPVVDLDRDEINIDRETIVDTVGTGGDATNTFNVSTTTAFVVAGAGVKVAKHGNRAVSSRCGSADVIEALGINLSLTPEQVAECIREVGIGFLFAPQLHGAMRYAIGPRREIGIRTIFNILGPLTNPAGANVLVVGVYEERLTELLAGVLRELGTQHAFVVHGEGSFDEISITGPTRVCELQNGEIRSYTITPEQFGLRRGSLADIRGGDVFANAAIVRAVLAGEPGPKQDMVALNAAAACIGASLVADFAGGIALAKEVIASGRALAKLEALIAKSRSFGPQP
ncbi:MAG: anthranilate phosphoribosyltransferase [Desulfobacca sp.]|uniref:anthranilate phosphoribosyltransferase n=1 Tax=Desulfobacca sp. TaxID=2067990 RepID=UPI004049AEB8